ncbi:MAG: sulfatase [Planctomycetota bacterium]
MPRRPNILFFLPDQHRFDWTGFNPDVPVRTPTLDRLADRGVRFRDCITPSPLCAPARACLANGHDIFHCGVADNGQNLPLSMPTYYQRLRDVGYRVAGVGKFDLHKPERDWGLDGSRLLDEWGFTEGIDNEGKLDAVGSGAETPMGPYMKYLHDKGLAAAHVEDFRSRDNSRSTFPTPLPEEAYCDNWIADNGIRFLQSFPAETPWHLVVNFTGPHNPMDVTERMKQLYDGVSFPPPHHNTEEMSPDQHQEVRRNYSAMVENIDRQMARMIDMVAKRGELDNTLVVFCSDHGEMLGDHQMWGKSTWRHPSVCVPMVVAGPGVAEGGVSEAVVQLHDVAGTILDWADAEPLPGTDGWSMRAVLEDPEEDHREMAFSALWDWEMAWDGRFKLVVEKDQPDRLYDLETDPHEDTNLAESQPRIVTRMKAVLEEVK